MKKKIRTFILAAALCFSQILPSGSDIYTANADNSGASVEIRIADKEADHLNIGDKFYADVSVAPMRCSTFALNAVWDRDQLELTNAVSGSGAFDSKTSPLTYLPFSKSGGNVSAEQSLANYRDGLSDDVCVFAFSSPADVNCSGTVVTLEFTVKDNAENGISRVEVYFDEDDPPKNIASENIRITQSTDEEHDGIAEADITGGIHLDTGINGFDLGNFPGKLEPEFSQDIRDYDYIIPKDERYVPRVSALLDEGVSADIVQADSIGDTAVIRVSAKRETVYRINFVEDNSNKAYAPVIFPASRPVLRDTDIYIYAKGDVYFTLDGTDPDMFSNRYYNYISADDFGLPQEYKTMTIKAISYEEGKEPSDIVTAEFQLPDTSLKLGGITVSGAAVPMSDTDSFIYQINYNDWRSGNNLYTIDAKALLPTSNAYAEPSAVSFDSIDGKGSEKKISITVSSAEGDSKVYDLTLRLLDCAHSSFEEEDTADCSHSGLYITKCSICGKIISEDFSEAFGHYAGTPQVTASTCDSEGSIVTYCVICQKEISREITPAAGKHIWSETSQSGGVLHRKCSVCGTSEDLTIYSASSDDHTHNFNGSSQTVIGSTCTNIGVMRTYCSAPDCTAYIEESIPLKEHTPAAPEETKASCTSEGSIVTKCADCGKIIKTEVVSALGHKFEFEKVSPSCSEDITLTASCLNGCGETLTYIIPRAKHNFSVQKFDKTGHWYECSVCGAKDKVEPHIKDTEGVPTGEPGVKNFYCTECEYIVSTETEVTFEDPGTHIHHFGNEWQSDTTKHWKVCSECGERSELGIHIEDGGVNIGGVINYSCAVCGQLIRTETAESSHKHTISYSDLFESDSTAHWHVCRGCGEIFDRSEHIENSGVITKDAAIGSEGVKTYYCAVCGYEMRSEVIPAIPAPKKDPNVNFETVGSAEKVEFTYIDENGDEQTVPENETSEIFPYVEDADMGMSSEEKLRETYDADAVAIYDISLFYNNIEVQPDNIIRVSLPVPDGLEGEKLTVYHRNSEGGFDAMPTSFESSANMLSFETDHFSIYVLAQPADNGTENNEGEGSGSGEAFPTPPPYPSGNYPSHDRPELPDDYGNPNIFGAPGGYKNNGQGEDVSSAAGLKAVLGQAGSFVYVGTIFIIAGTAWLICRRFVKKRKKQ